MERSLSFRSHSPSSSSSSRLNATLNIKHNHSETVESIPMSPDGSYTFTSTLPMPPSPALAASLSSSSYASSSSSSTTAYKKVTTIRAPKKSPIIINLSSDSAVADFASGGSVVDVSSPRPASASPLSPSQSLRFASTAPLGKAAVESSTRAELAKETRARIKAQQKQREEHEVHRQQEESLERENRTLRRQLDEATAQLHSARQQLSQATQTADIQQQQLMALEADKEKEVAGLLSELENNIRQWEAEKQQWDTERTDMRQQQIITDLAVTALQDKVAELQAAVQCEEGERRRVKGWWMDAQKQVGVLEDEVRVWRQVQTEERQKHAEIMAEYEQIRTAYTGLVDQQLQQQQKDGEQLHDTAADTAEGGAEGREQPGAKFSRASIVAPLLSPVQQVSSHIGEQAEDKAKYDDNERSAQPPIDEQITAIVVEQAAQATQQLESLTVNLTEANSALHRHVRQQSRSHLHTEQQLTTQLEAFRVQTRTLLEERAAFERRMESAVEKHKAVWKQLGKQMNENAAMKKERDALRQSITQLTGQLTSLQQLRADEERKHAELIDVLKGELGGAEESVKRSTAVYMDYLNRLTQTQKELTDAQETIAKQIAGAERSSALVSQLTMQLAERRQEAERREQELQEAKNRVTALKASVDQLTSELAARREASERMERQLNAELFDLRGQQQWAKLASEHDAATIASLRAANTSTVRQWQLQQRDSHKQLASITAERDFFGEQLSRAEECRAELCENIQQLERDKAEAEQEVQNTQSEKRQLADQLRQTAAQLKEQRQHSAALESWMHDDQQHARQQASEQKALRIKLGSLIERESQVVKRVTRSKHELEAVLKASLSALSRTEERRAAADSEVSALRKERDEFDAILQGALRELQIKEETIVDLSHDQEERQTIIEQLYRDKQATTDYAAHTQNKLQANLVALDKQKSELHSVLTDALAELRKREGELDEAGQREDVLEAVLVRTQAERHELHAVLTEAIAELSKREGKLDEAGQREEDMDALLSRSQADKTELQCVLTEALAELRSCEVELDEAGLREEELEALLSRSQTEKSELSDVLQQVVVTLARLEVAYSQTVDEAQRTERDREQYRSVYEEALAELRHKEQHIRQLGEEEERLHFEVSRATAGKQELSDVLRSAMHSLSTVENSLATTARENDDLTSALNASADRRKEAESEIVELNALIAKHEKLAATHDETIRQLYEQSRRQERDSAAQRDSETQQRLATITDEVSRLRALCGQQQAIIEQLTSLRDELQRLVAELLAGAHDKAREAEAKLELARVQADIEVRDGLTRELKKAHDELVSVEAERVAQQQQAEQVKNELSDTQSQLAEKEQQLRASRDEESRLQRELAEADDDRDTLTAALSAARAESARLSAEQDELSGRASELEARLQKSDLLCAEMQKLQESRESLIQTLLTQCDSYKQQQDEDSASRQQEQATFSSQVTSLQSRVAELSGQYDSVQAAIRRVEGERDTFETQLREVSRQHDQDAGHLQQAMSDLDAVTAAKQQAIRQLSIAQQTVDEQTQQLADATRTKDELDAVLRDVLSTLSAKEQQAEKDDEDARQLRRYLGSIIAQLQARKMAAYRANAELSTVLREVVQTLNAREAELQAAQLQAAVLQTEHATLTEAVLLADEDLQAAQSKLGEAREQLRVSKVRAGEDAQEIAKQTEEITRLRTEVATKADELTAAQEQLDLTAAQLDDAKHETTVAQQQAKAAAYRDEERRVKTEAVEDKLRELHIQLNIAQQAVKDKDRSLGDNLRLRAHTQQQLEEAQHQIQLLTDSLTSAAAAAEDHVMQHRQKQQAESDDRIKQLEGVIGSRNGELAALEEQLHALQAEFARHNDEDHKQMEQQSVQWQDEQDALKDECKQLEQQLQHTRQQLSDLDTHHEQLTQQLNDNHQQLEQLEQQRVEKDKEIESLRSEIVVLHTHNGGSNHIALNAIIECQSATLEAQLLPPASPTSPASSTSPTPSSQTGRTKGRPAAVDTKAGRVDPMVKVLQANHKKEVATLEKQLEKAHTERRALEKKVRELEKRTDSLSALKSQAEYKQKDISEHERTQQTKLAAIEKGMEEAVKEKTRLAVECADMKAKLEQASVDRERILASEKEREEQRTLREKQWMEERSRLEQRIAALHGRGTATHRRKKSGSSVTFKDDAALHVGDLRYEIGELQHENGKLLATIQRLSNNQYVQGKEDEEVKEMDEQAVEEDGEVEEIEEQFEQYSYVAEESDSVEVSVSVTSSVSQYQTAEADERVIE